jgi:hypothetical protein
MIRVVEPVRRDNLPAVVQDRGKHRSPNSRGGEVAVGRVERRRPFVVVWDRGLETDPR